MGGGHTWGKGLKNVWHKKKVPELDSSAYPKRYKIWTHVRLVQEKSKNMIWLYALGWGGGCVECAGAKKSSSYGGEFKIIFALAVTTSFKMNKKSKAKYVNDSNSEYESDHLNNKNLDIGADFKSEHGHKEWIDKVMVYFNSTVNK